MEITPGYWRQRDGGRAKVAGVNEHANVAAYATGWDSRQFTVSWYRNGRVSINNPSYRDLIKPWVDRPEWPACEVAAWIKYIAQDASGRWYGYAEKPQRSDSVWDLDSAMYNIFPKEYAPTWTGDWTKSLIERPKQS